MSEWKQLEFDFEDKTRLIVDPPSGWRYGFPCEWDKKNFPDYEDFLRSKGYPEDLMNIAMSASFMWIEEIKDDSKV